jgi:hypothetical protein
VSFGISFDGTTIFQEAASSYPDAGLTALVLRKTGSAIYSSLEPVANYVVS